MTSDLDLLAVIRATLDALDLVIEAEQRRTGSVEGQQAAAAARRARIALDQQSLRSVG